MIKKLLLSVFLVTVTCGDSLDDEFGGFDDAPVVKKEVLKEEKQSFFETYGISGELSQQFSKNFSSKSSLFLDFEHKFENDFRIKINAKQDVYRNNDIDTLDYEGEIYDAFLEAKISDAVDFKLGRQVLVWGRSDTIRITDVLNPLDNRRPAMVDIEDLRLPINMLKFDYYFGDYELSLISVLEQRFSKNPSLGSMYYPLAFALPDNQEYNDITGAISLNAQFKAWDISFYASQLRDDIGYIGQGKIQHDKVNMLANAINILKGSWLIKSELAYFDALKYTQTAAKEFQRIDGLIGVEYNGIADTLFSFDTSLRKIFNYDNILKTGFSAVEKDTYQHAFRVSSDFKNATLHFNYLVSLFGDKMDEGGFQRLWLKYDVNDAISTNFGLVDYVGGSTSFDALKTNDMLFFEVAYSF